MEFLNTSILATDNYVLVTLLQNYQSATINDLGRKLLYLRQNEFYEYKIIHESWNKDGLRNVDSLSSLVAFKPSLRFFDTLDSNQILQTNLKKENN